jgi:hypothetical protein
MLPLSNVVHLSVLRQRQYGGLKFTCASVVAEHATVIPYRVGIGRGRGTRSGVSNRRPGVVPNHGVIFIDGEGLWSNAGILSEVYTFILRVSGVNIQGGCSFAVAAIVPTGVENTLVPVAR